MTDQPKPKNKGGRPKGTTGIRQKVKSPLGDILDPKLIINKKLGPGELATSLTPKEKEVFQKVTKVSYDRWQEQMQERLQDLADKILTRALDNVEKIPPNFLVLNLSQTMGLIQKDKLPGVEKTGGDLHIHMKADDFLKKWGLAAGEKKVEAVDVPVLKPADSMGPDVVHSEGSE